MQAISHVRRLNYHLEYNTAWNNVRGNLSLNVTYEKK